MPGRNYLYNKWVDSVFILSPPFVSLLLVALLPQQFRYSADMPLSAWVILVLFIDVAHVYSTLFRTYFDKETFAAQKNIMLTIPLLCGVASMLLYSYSDMLFWRILAYLAVYHFIRQQYGFMRIYSRNEPANTWHRRIDSLTIYAAAGYPVIYWHLHLHRNFNWFVAGDFLQVDRPELSRIFWALYLLILVVYLVKEIHTTVVTRQFNINKNMVILGTAFSWYFGIVYYNGDLAFTLLNVVAHGIPYMALVWVWGRKKSEKEGFGNNAFLKFTFKGAGIVVFVSVILLLAFIEEGLWDAIVWREHESIFPVFNALFGQAGKELLKLVVPLLALPQIVHYVIDGYIWKIKNDRFNWSKQVLK